MLKQGFTLSFLLLLCLLPVTISYATEPTAEKNKTIRVACSTGYPPLSSMTSSGEIHGILIDLWKLWGRKMDKKVTFHISTWDDSIKAVKNGEADIHMGLFRTPEREKWLNFTQPIYEVESRLFFPQREEAITALSDLAGKKVGVINGSYHETYIREKCPDALIVKFQNSDDMVTSCAYGWLTAFMDEVPTAVNILKRLGRLSEFASLKKSSFRKKIYGAVLQENNKLLSEITKGLDIISSEDMEKLESRYLDAPYQVYGAEDRIKLTEAEKKWLKEHPEIKLGMGRAWPPVQYMDNDGQFKGIATDYINLLNRKLKLNLQPERYLSWSDIIKKGKNREIDLYACVAPTSEHKKYMSFSSPYLSFPLVAFTKADNKSIKTINDLNGKKVSALRGLASHESIKAEHPDIKLVLADSIYEGLNNVLSGKASAFIGNLATTSYTIQSNRIPDLKVACSFQNNALCFGVRNDWPELISIINKVLGTLTKEERDNIQRKWFSIKPQQLKTTTRGTGSLLTQIIFAFSVVSIILLVMLIKEKQNSSKYAALLDNDNELLLAFNQEGTISYQSDSFKDMLGFKSGELIKQSIFTLYKEQDHDELKSIISSLSEGKIVAPWNNNLLDKQKNPLAFETYFINKLDSLPLNAIIMHSKRKRNNE
jgi:polar amino acid transport system substrate-binding protein